MADRRGKDPRIDKKRWELAEKKEIEAKANAEKVKSDVMAAVAALQKKAEEKKEAGKNEA